MSKRNPIPLPVAADDERPDQGPAYRYWGSQKPPANALILCQATPRLSADSTKATIRLYGPIDPYGGIWGTSAKEVAAALDGLDDTVTELQLRINSPGGSCFEGLAILNLLRAHPVKVIAVVDGLAASAASFIAAGCDETVMSPGTTMMVHGPSGLVWGTAADMRETAGVLDKIAASMASLYAEATGTKPAQWLTTMQTDTWYTAEEAVEAGLADSVAVVPDAGHATTAGAEPDEGDAEEVTEPEALARRYAAMFDPAASHQAPSTRTTPTASADGSITTQEGSPAVAFSDEQVTNMRQELGLPEDADEATIVAALSEALEERADEPTASTPQVPEGMVLVDSAVYATLKQGAEAGRSARQELDAQARDRAISAAIEVGKTTPARRDHWVTSWAADPEGTKALLDSLEPGLVVPTAEIGTSAEPAEGELDPDTTTALDAYAAQMGLPKEALRA